MFVAMWMCEATVCVAMWMCEVKATQHTHPFMGVPTLNLTSSDRLDVGSTYYFEFLEKAYDGMVISEVKVGELYCTNGALIWLLSVEDS